MGKFLILLLSFSMLACTSRGLKLGEQIPEFHPEYDATKPQVFTRGGNSDKVIYDSLGNEVKKSTGHESKFLEDSVKHVVKGKDGYLYYQVHPDLQRKERLAEEQGAEYSKLSMDDSEKALVFYSGYNNVNKDKAEVVVEEGDTLYSLSQKIYGDVSKWKQLAISNLHLIRIIPGDVLHVKSPAKKTVKKAASKVKKND